MKRFIALLTALLFALTILAGAAVAKPHENKGMGLGQDKQEQKGNLNKNRNEEDEDKDRQVKGKEHEQERVHDSVYKNIYGQNVANTVYGQVYGLPFRVGNPNQPVKSLEGLVLVMKAAGLTPGTGTVTSGKDYKKIPVWGRAWIKLAIEKGLLSTKQLKKFNPNQGMKWGELKAYCTKLGLQVPEITARNEQRSIVQSVYQSVYQTVYQSVYQSVYETSPPPVRTIKINPNTPVKWFMVKPLVDKALGK